MESTWDTLKSKEGSREEDAGAGEIESEIEIESEADYIETTFMADWDSIRVEWVC